MATIRETEYLKKPPKRSSTSEDEGNYLKCSGVPLQELKRSKMEDQKQTIKKDLIFNIISRKIKQLPESERYLFEHRSTYIRFNGAFSGLIANSLFRRILHVTQARLASSLPMALMPFMTASLTFTGFISLPLSTGCTSWFWYGWLYPILLAIPVNGGLAAWYDSSPLIQKGNILNYWITVSKPVCRKMLFPIVLQTVFAAYLGCRQYKLLIKVCYSDANVTN
ncbi:hypothetical protein U0070_003846, partial [Myodes glareolus]